MDNIYSLLVFIYNGVMFVYAKRPPQYHNTNLGEGYQPLSLLMRHPGKSSTLLKIIIFIYLNLPIKIVLRILNCIYCIYCIYCFLVWFPLF